MSELATRYLELLNEMEWHRATRGLARAEEIDFAGRLDRIWTKLTEAEQEEIERELHALDSGKRDDEFLCDDTDVAHGTGQGPRRAA